MLDNKIWFSRIIFVHFLVLTKVNVQIKGNNLVSIYDLIIIKYSHKFATYSRKEISLDCNLIEVIIALFNPNGFQSFCRNQRCFLNVTLGVHLQQGQTSLQNLQY